MSEVHEVLRMNAKLNKRRIVVSAALLAAGAAFAAWAQNEAPADPAPAEEASESREATPAGPIPDENRLPPTSDDEFIPSEELQADEEVTFPVDI